MNLFETPTDPPSHTLHLYESSELFHHLYLSLLHGKPHDAIAAAVELDQSGNSIYSKIIFPFVLENISILNPRLLGTFLLFHNQYGKNTTEEEAKKLEANLCNEDKKILRLTLIKAIGMCCDSIKTQIVPHLICMAYHDSFSELKDSEIDPQSLFENFDAPLKKLSCDWVDQLGPCTNPLLEKGKGIDLKKVMQLYVVMLKMIIDEWADLELQMNQLKNTKNDRMNEDMKNAKIDTLLQNIEKKKKELHFSEKMLISVSQIICAVDIIEKRRIATKMKNNTIANQRKDKKKPKFLADVLNKIPKWANDLKINQKKPDPLYSTPILMAFGPIFYLCADGLKSDIERIHEKEKQEEKQRQYDSTITCLCVIIDLMVRGIGNKNVLFVNAILLITRKANINWKTEINVPHEIEINSDLYCNQIHNNDGNKLSQCRTIGIPPSSLTFATHRGNGKDTIDLLTQNPDLKHLVHQWSQEEIAKSHGLAINTDIGQTPMMKYLEAISLKSAECEIEDFYITEFTNAMLSDEKLYGYNHCFYHEKMARRYPQWLKIFPSIVSYQEVDDKSNIMNIPQTPKKKGRRPKQIDPTALPLKKYKKQPNVEPKKTIKKAMQLLENGLESMIYMEYGQSKISLSPPLQPFLIRGYIYQPIQKENQIPVENPNGVEPSVIINSEPTPMEISKPTEEAPIQQQQQQREVIIPLNDNPITEVKAIDVDKKSIENINIPPPNIEQNELSNNVKPILNPLEKLDQPKKTKHKDRRSDGPKGPDPLKTEPISKKRKSDNNIVTKSKKNKTEGDNKSTESKKNQSIDFLPYLIRNTMDEKEIHEIHKQLKKKAGKKIKKRSFIYGTSLYYGPFYKNEKDLQQVNQIIYRNYFMAAWGDKVLIQSLPFYDSSLSAIFMKSDIPKDKTKKAIDIEQSPLFKDMIQPFILNLCFKYLLGSPILSLNTIEYDHHRLYSREIGQEKKRDKTKGNSSISQLLFPTENTNEKTLHLESHILNGYDKIQKKILNIEKGLNEAYQTFKSKVNFNLNPDIETLKIRLNILKESLKKIHKPQEKEKTKNNSDTNNKKLSKVLSLF